MLVLLFEAAGSRHALSTRDVVEVVPRVDMRPVPASPPWVAGYFSYRGAVTPALDLGLLCGGESCAMRWNSRLILVRLPGGSDRCVGLLADRVTTAELPNDALRTQTVDGGWGPLLLDDRGLFQFIELPRLLANERVRGVLAAGSQQV